MIKIKAIIQIILIQNLPISNAFFKKVALKSILN